MGNFKVKFGIDSSYGAPSKGGKFCGNCGKLL